MAGGNYTIDVAGANESLHVQVLEMNECARFWMEAENGVKLPVVVKGDVNEIIRRTASLGKEFGHAEAGHGRGRNIHHGHSEEVGRRHKMLDADDDTLNRDLRTVIVAHS